MHKISIKAGFSRMDFAKWALRIKYKQVDSVPRALMMADDLLRGCTFDIYLSDEDKVAGEMVCTITEIEEENPWREHFRAQSEYQALCKLGAAGDVKAAVAYCKLEAQGLVSHGAIG